MINVLLDEHKVKEAVIEKHEKLDNLVEIVGGPMNFSKCIDNLKVKDIQELKTLTAPP